MKNTELLLDQAVAIENRASRMEEYAKEDGLNVKTPTDLLRASAKALRKVVADALKAEEKAAKKAKKG